MIAIARWPLVKKVLFGFCAKVRICVTNYNIIMIKYTKELGAINLEKIFLKKKYV